MEVAVAEQITAVVQQVANNLSPQKNNLHPFSELEEHGITEVQSQITKDETNRDSAEAENASPLTERMAAGRSVEFHAYETVQGIVATVCGLVVAQQMPMPDATDASSAVSGQESQRADKSISNAQSHVLESDQSTSSKHEARPLEYAQLNEINAQVTDIILSICDHAAGAVSMQSKMQESALCEQHERMTPRVSAEKERLSITVDQGSEQNTGFSPALSLDAEVGKMGNGEPTTGSSLLGKDSSQSHERSIATQAAVEQQLASIIDSVVQSISPTKMSNSNEASRSTVEHGQEPEAVTQHNAQYPSSCIEPSNDDGCEQTDPSEAHEEQDAFQNALEEMNRIREEKARKAKALPQDQQDAAITIGLACERCNQNRQFVLLAIRTRAVIVIQSLGRAVKARLRVKDIRSELRKLMIERQIADMDAELEDSRQFASATRLQSCYKCHVSRTILRTLRRLNEERIKAEAEQRLQSILQYVKEAQRIQTVWSGHRGRKLFRKIAASAENERFAKHISGEDAINDGYHPGEDDEDDPPVDSDFGDRSAPSVVTNKYRERLNPFVWGQDPAHHSGAIKLQKVVRGHFGRLLSGEMETLKRRTLQASAQAAATLVADGLEAFAVKSKENRRVALATLPDSFIQASTRIQKVFRGHLGRGLIQQIRTKVAAEQARFRSFQALRIQRWLRGERGRQYVRRMVAERAREARHKSASTIIQKRVRGIQGREKAKRARLAWEERRAQAEKRRQARMAICVIVLQKVFRGHMGRAEYRVHQRHAAEQLRLKMIHLNKCASKVQSLFRGWRFRNAAIVDARTARVVGAARRLQRVIRGHSGRQEFKTIKAGSAWFLETRMSRLLQCNYRMRIARRRLAVRKEWLRLSRYATRVQKVFRGHAGRRQFSVSLHVLMQFNAATKIQSLYRGIMGRERVRLLKHKRRAMQSASLVQRAWQCRLCRRELRWLRQNAADLRRLQASRRLQRVVRGHFGRVAWRLAAALRAARADVALMNQSAHRLLELSRQAGWGDYHKQIEGVAGQVDGLLHGIQGEEGLAELRDKLLSKKAGKKGKKTPGSSAPSSRASSRPGSRAGGKESHTSSSSRPSSRQSVSESADSSSPLRSRMRSREGRPTSSGNATRHRETLANSMSNRPNSRGDAGSMKDRVPMPSQSVGTVGNLLSESAVERAMATKLKSALQDSLPVEKIDEVVAAVISGLAGKQDSESTPPASVQKQTKAGSTKPSHARGQDLESDSKPSKGINHQRKGPAVSSRKMGSSHPASKIAERSKPTPTVVKKKQRVVGETDSVPKVRKSSVQTAPKSRKTNQSVTLEQPLPKQPPASVEETDIMSRDSLSAPKLQNSELPADSEVSAFEFSSSSQLLPEYMRGKSLPDDSLMTKPPTPVTLSSLMSLPPPPMTPPSRQRTPSRISSAVAQDHAGRSGASAWALLGQRASGPLDLENVSPSLRDSPFVSQRSKDVARSKRASRRHQHLEALLNLAEGNSGVLEDGIALSQSGDIDWDQQQPLDADRVEYTLLGVEQRSAKQSQVSRVEIQQSQQDPSLLAPHVSDNTSATTSFRGSAVSQRVSEQGFGSTGSHTDTHHLPQITSDLVFHAMAPTSPMIL